MDEIVQWIISHIGMFLWMIILVAVASIGIAYAQLRNFSDTSNQVIARSGGLTHSAYNILNKQSKNRYNNMFHVRLNDKQEYAERQVDYGDTVNYEIQVNMPLISNILKTAGKESVQTDVRPDD